MLAALALVARHDPRPRVADAAAAAVVGCAEAHYGGWSAAVWDSVLRRALSYIVDLPYPPSADEDGSTPAARRVVSNTYNRLFLLALSRVLLGVRIHAQDKTFCPFFCLLLEVVCRCLHTGAIYERHTSSMGRHQ